MLDILNVISCQYNIMYTCCLGSNYELTFILQSRRQPQIENGIAQGFTHTTKRNPGNFLSVENGTSVGVHSMKVKFFEMVNRLYFYLKW